MREDLALLAAELRLIARDRHVTDGALIFDVRLRFGMIDNLAANASLPVRVARGVSHHTGAPLKPYGDIGARSGDEAVMTGKAAVRGLELGLVALGLDAVAAGAEYARGDERGDRDFSCAHYVPICSRVGGEVAVSDEFRHGSPHAAQPARLAKALA